MSRRRKPPRSAGGKPRAVAHDVHVAVAAKLNRAQSLYETGALAPALELYREAARSIPSNHLLLLAVATVALDLGMLGTAEAFLTKALILKPDDAVAWVNLSGASIRGEAKSKASVRARRALILSPLDQVALTNHAKSLNGVGRSTEFEMASRRAAITGPADPMAVVQRLLWSAEVNEPETTIRMARHGLTLLPGDPTYLSNMGAALAELERDLDAEISYRRSLTSSPGFAPAWYNLGNLLERQDEIDRAIRAHDRGVLLRPDNGDYHFNRAVTLLLDGRFKAGFEAMEWRWRSAVQSTAWQDAGAAIWNGEELNGKSVLVWAEQGLGDSIQFSRYLRLVRDRGGRALLEVQPELAPLFMFSPLADAVFARGTDPLPDADYHIPMMSLPRIAASTIESVPAPTVFSGLPAPKSDRAWPDGFNVGLVWAGNPKHKRDRERSIPLPLLAPLAALAGVNLHVLQHGPARDQIDTCGFADRLIRHPETADFLEAAGLIQCMDLVITVDTSHAHLAGTLGIETWIPQRQVPDWRWLRKRQDSIWYPSVTLYRQDTRLDWQPVVDRVTADLGRRLVEIRQA